MISTTSSKLLPLPTLALVLAMVLWSSSFIALKIAFREYDPMVVIFGRMLVASICFLVIGKRLTSSLNYQKGDYKLILFMAFCEPCLYFIFEAKAVENTTASQAGIITAMLPILVMVSAALFLKEQVSKKAWAGAVIAVLGVLWLTAESSPSSDAPNPVLGNFLELLAMVCAAGYTISLKALTDRYSPFFLTAIQALIGCVFYFPLLFLPSTQLPLRFEPHSGLAIIYLGAVITLGAYGLFNYGIKCLPANKGAIFVNLIPIFSVILGWLILGEAFTLWQFFAGGLILGGVYLSQK
ncbi:DMT family transporter [Desulforhopalus sp. IMCC35007]|uniref:DMT family transporter n=1 Tax=Desulforhopalus sp. IMCC35007 TaxID=2569543 RepID=UPI0010AE12E5|nr:DMT family transporter [Desulforhopalus sp. IMCC35007]TKB12120.1 DMT family transporter [Desulforhopalus sp. IMCC35007]